MRRTLLILFCLATLFSCVNTKKALYFSNTKDTSFTNNIALPVPQIRSSDLLSINVSSLNPEASKIFNQPNRTDIQSSTATGETVYPSGYLVNEQGYIRFPILGDIKATGLTKMELQDQIRTSLINKKLLLDPIIEIRHLNFKVSVLGEVARPTLITVPNEKITLLEALSLAGDMTIYAKRKNILVIREDEGKRVLKRLDLTSEELFNSSYYYLKSNDIVYVEPNKAKINSASKFYQLLPSIIGTLTASIIIFDRLAQ